MNHVPLQLFDPRRGEPAMRVQALGTDIDLQQPCRFNYFSVIWVRRGRGTYWSDVSHHPFEPGTLLFAVPYQIVRLEPSAGLVGDVVQFHANFLCIETHHEEVGCNGVLFHECAGEPLVAMDEALARQFDQGVEALRRELREAGLAHSEALVSHLKLLLIAATRAKLRQQDVPARVQSTRPPILDRLRELIELHHRERWQPAEYARRLHLAPKTLAKLVKTHLRTTVTDLIRDRVMREAKWQMLHTLKPVKQVAAELGFQDVFYFSRVFKRATGCSPTFFREYETAIRGGRNLPEVSRFSEE